MQNYKEWLMKLLKNVTKEFNLKILFNLFYKKIIIFLLILWKKAQDLVMVFYQPQATTNRL